MTDFPLSIAHDPIHGVIEAGGGTNDVDAATIARLISFPPLRRLASINQLPFVSQRFLGADHSRYAHAIGTYHVCGTIIDKLTSRKTLTIPDRSLRDRFQAAFKKRNSSSRSVIITHTLAAALLQDLGELPYGHVTSDIYEPREDLRKTIATRTGTDSSIWSAKDVFSVACVWSDKWDPWLVGLDKGLLSFLIAPRYYEIASREKELSAWLGMLDGTMDADRLDYVYRDAYHTIGGRGSPASVLSALLGYDGNGPILRDTGAVTDFLTTRANLWRSVYLDGRTRLGRILLSQILVYIHREADGQLNNFASSHGLRLSLSLDDFIAFDDHSLWSFLKKLKSDPKMTGELDTRTAKALDLVLNDYRQYSQEWVTHTTTSSGTPKVGSLPKKAAGLPSDLFYDPFLELYEHSLYQPGSIWIQSPSLSPIGNSLPLEKCVGHFNELLQRKWSAHPLPDHMQVHIPRRRPASTDWQRFDALRKNGGLYDALLKDESQLTSNIPFDTILRRNFSKPVIGISFCWGDELIVRRLVQILYNRKQKYIILMGPMQGYGTPTIDNSKKLVSDSDVVLCVLSREYVEKHKAALDGNLSAEIYEMQNRIDRKKRGDKSQQSFRVLFISLDDFEAVKNFSFNALGQDPPGFCGDPLRGSGVSKLQAAVRVVLEKAKEP